MVRIIGCGEDWPIWNTTLPWRDVNDECQLRMFTDVFEMA